MIKTIYSDDYDWGESPLQLIKLSNRGLRGYDRSQFEKRAGQSIMSQLDNVRFQPDEIPVHLYALGTTEAVGPNRNYDGFPKAACRKFHDTFVKYARWYSEHANRDPAKSYGLVKCSAFNEAMQRIELICALNRTKEAAERNGGLVATKQAAKLDNGDTLGVSMSCKISLDNCSYCGNAASSRANYCRAENDGGHCKAGGLSRNMGRVLSDGHVLHAENHEPYFFDISDVAKPACRIAYVTGQLQKAASLDSHDGLDILPPLSLFQDQCFSNLKLATHVELLHRLACMEQEVLPNYANQLQVGGSSQTIPMPKEAQEHPRLALRAISEVGGVLSLASFLQLFGNQSDKEAAQTVGYVGDKLQRCFSSVLVNGNLEEQLSEHAFNPAYTTTSTLQKWANSIASDVSFSPGHVKTRTMRGAINDHQPSLLKQALVKSAGVDQVLAQYAIYKSAAVLNFFSQTSKNPLTATLAIIQNRIQ